MSLEPEKISALMDDAMGERERRGSLETLLDEEARGCWERYHFVGAALRGQISGHELQLAAQVRTALAQLADAAEDGMPPQRSAPQRWRNMPPNWYWAGAGGLALAASAVFAVVALAPPAPTLTPGMPAFAQAPDRVVIPPEKLNTRRDRPAEAPHAAQLNRYLVGHYAAASGDTGVLPFITLVGYEGRNGSR